MSVPHLRHKSNSENRNLSDEIVSFKTIKTKEVNQYIVLILVASTLSILLRFRLVGVSMRFSKST